VSLRFLLDTNIVSEPLRALPDAWILKRLRRHQAEIAIASIVWHELWFGCRRLPPSVKCAIIEKYLLEVIAPSMPVLPTMSWRPTGMPPSVRG
jgi:tRNA(fMet)-specific endonuclease VapC